jgi:hypothetical protein
MGYVPALWIDAYACSKVPALGSHEDEHGSTWLRRSEKLLVSIGLGLVLMAVAPNQFGFMQIWDTPKSKALG